MGHCQSGWACRAMCRWSPWRPGWRGSSCISPALFCSGPRGGIARLLVPGSEPPARILWGEVLTVPSVLV
eukprot:737146-Pyramimonas_sp.AAC.1